MSDERRNATSRITPPLKWHCCGGKSYLAKQIIGLMPPRCKNPNAPAADDPGWLAYVEPYAGGLAVLLAQDPEGISEVVNDLNGDLTNFWTTLQNAPLFDLLYRLVSVVPFSEAEWTDAVAKLEESCKANDYDPHGGNLVVRAAWFFTACRQSLAGRMKSFTPLSKTRTRRGMNEQAAAWLGAVEGLPAVHARLKRVAIVGPKDALEVVRQQDGPRTLFYLDPPYASETRAAPDVYAHEMNECSHAVLLMRLAEIQGKFLLSGYRSDTYDTAAKHYGWNRHDFEISNHASGGDTKRRMVESVWTNY